VEKELSAPVKSEKLDDKVSQLSDAIQQAVKEVLPTACKAINLGLRNQHCCWQSKKEK